MDEDGDTYPGDCDIHPYWAIWKACDELEGKLHWDELNRELMHVFRHADLNAVIDKIRVARAVAGYDPVAGGTAASPLSPRCYDNDAPPEGRSGDGQVRDQRTTPWFKRASLGELLLSSPGAHGNGYWSIRPEFRELIHDWVSKGPPPFRLFASKDEWYRHLSGQVVTVDGRPVTNLIKSLSVDVLAANLIFTEQSLLRFAASLLSKRFVILTGLAGSGKTKLAQALAHWLTPDPGLIDHAEPSKGKNPNPYYALVPVGSDWTGNENIVGYPDGLHTACYVAKPALALICHALEPTNADVPHFLILDEMNLSHVERYFADLLSAIESREEIPLYQGDIRKSDGKNIPRSLRLPDNLFIIGTVNVDETTYMFSPKVLDRANVIEFRMQQKEMDDFLGSVKATKIEELDGKGLAFAKNLVAAAGDKTREVPNVVKDIYKSEMVLFFKLMREHGTEFGYRTAYETARFVHFFKLLGEYPDDKNWFSTVMDCVIVQKFLPKLHGSRAKLGPLLKKLWFICVSDETARGADALKAAEESATSTDKKNEPSGKIPSGAPYPLSADKIARMWRLLNDNGFASFAEA